jgi:hypothetical protein
VEKELAILRAKLPHIDDQLCAQGALATHQLRSSDAILKKPSIAEALDWAAALDALGVKELTPDALRRTAGFVLKNNDDIDHFLAQPLREHSHDCTCGGHCANPAGTDTAIGNRSQG